MSIHLRFFKQSRRLLSVKNLRCLASVEENDLRHQKCFFNHKIQIYDEVWFI